MNEQSLFSADQLVELPVAEVRAEAPAQARLRRPERRQVLLRPVSLEQLLPADHPARIIWAAVQLLDWSMFEQAITARGETPGRPATDPRVLATLWDELSKVEEAKARQKNKASKHRPARASATDPQCRVEKMPDKGYRPVHRIQLAEDPVSRAIMGVAVGSNDKEQGERMREQVQRRTGARVDTQIYDGNYVKLENIDKAHEQGTTILAPVPKPRKKGQDRHAPRRDDSPAVAQWRQRMNTPEAREMYRRRASTSETVNADLTTCRGLGRLLVRGTQKVLSVALWSALGYNLMHFAAALIG